jgi:hypothetical protein
MRVARIEWRVAGQAVEVDADRPLHEARGSARIEAGHLARDLAPDAVAVEVAPAGRGVVERYAVRRGARVLAWVVLREVGRY